MSAQQSSSRSPMVRYAVWAWLASLAVFFVWLILTVAGGLPPASLSGADPKNAGQRAVADTNYIVTGLLPWGSVPTPDMPFESGDGYVLSGYGLQGFYQSVPANSAWTLSLPEPNLGAQLVERGESPAPVTKNVTLSWEMDPQTGLAAGSAQNRKGDMELSPDGLSFIARVPVSPRQTDGGLNPYPVVRITARDAASGAVLAESAAVVAVAPGFGCALCHADAEYAILEVHDRHQGTDFQEQARQGAPVNCRACHDGITFSDGKATAGTGLGFSAAIHGWHAQYLGNKGAEACLSCHDGLGRSTDKPDERPLPLFARDVHIDRGLNCVDCHGTLEDHALALLKAEKEAGQSNADNALAVIQPRAAAAFADIQPRLPWVQLPDCAACHDFENKPRSGQASAFNKWTKDASGLFSARTDDMAVLRCPSCHGAPHAVYPARNPVGRDRDNIVPIQYQQHAKPLGAAGNCALCHMRTMDMSAHHPLVERKSTEVHVPEGAKLSQPRVLFSHDSHSGLECLTCHHKGHTDGASMLCVSSGCHDGLQPESENGKDNPMFFRKAFHGPGNSCFHCHSALRQKGEGAGPVACKDCHSAPSPRWAEEEAARTAAEAEKKDTAHEEVAPIKDDAAGEE